MRPRLGKALDPREVELKFQLPPGSRPAFEASPVLATVLAKQHHAVTTYFDTPDSRLDRAGLTLRVRQRGHSCVQAVKSRSNGHGVATTRSEWEWPIGQDVPDVGLLEEVNALAAVAPVIRGRLQPIFVTDVQRTIRLLHLDGDTVVELAIDEGSIAAGTAREPVSEVEMELKAGCVGAIYRLAAALQAHAPLWLSPESKSARGWHLHTGRTDGAQHAHVPKLGRHVRAAAGIHAILGGTLGHLTANIAPTLRGDVEALHQMRAALRGARTVLQLFEPHLDASTTERFNADLRRFGEIFGTARDWDVFCLETLPAAMVDLPAEKLRGLDLAGEAARQIAHAAVADALQGHDFTAMVLGLAGWAEAGLTQPSTLGDENMGKRLATLAPALLDRAAGRAVLRSQHASRLSPVERHDLRKSLKKLRHDAESLGGLYRTRAVRSYRARCEALEQILGAANDAAVTQRLVHTLASDSRSDLAKPADILTQWSEQRSHMALHGFKAALRDFQAAPTFWC